MPGRNGGWLKRGGQPGGPRPGSGRPPEAFRAACRELAGNDAILAYAREVLQDSTHPAWLGAWKFLASYAYGRPEETKTLKTEQPLTIRVVHE